MYNNDSKDNNDNILIKKNNNDSDNNIMIIAYFHIDSREKNKIYLVEKDDIQCIMVLSV